MTILWGRNDMQIDALCQPFFLFHKATHCWQESKNVNSSLSLRVRTTFLWCSWHFVHSFSHLFLVSPRVSPKLFGLQRSPCLLWLKSTLAQSPIPQMRGSQVSSDGFGQVSFCLHCHLWPRCCASHTVHLFGLFHQLLLPSTIHQCLENSSFQSLSPKLTNGSCG